ncbi:MAG: winged helix DNA-binding domain-containing protein [Micromonosporaceae bacterium]|nr:winged helix DNA-binding domain-containing protein [Micromonosporaceae bacterium]
MLSAPPGRARLMRARAQGLAGGVRCQGVAEVVDQVFAVQAQDLDAAALGLRVRAAGLTRDDVLRGYGVESAVVRGWFMRGTLHAVPAADAMWLTALFGPISLAASRRRHAELGLDEDLCARAEERMMAALAEEGPLTRAELTARLVAVGVPERGQAPFHLIRRAALRGLICHGAFRDGEAAFVPLSDRVGAEDPGWSPEEAAAELARRYLRAYAPATVIDFGTWSGLPMPLARRAWKALSDTVEIDVVGQACALPESRLLELDEEQPEADVRLVPAYDNYLVGYRTRALSVAEPYEKEVWPGGGQIRATVLIDGLAAGTWGRRGRSVDVRPFKQFSDAVAAGAAAEQADIARFLTP